MNTKNKLIETLQSRKFLVSMGTILMSVALYLMGHIDIDQLMGVIKPVSIGYVGSQGFVDAFKQLVPLLKDVLSKKT